MSRAEPQFNIRSRFVRERATLRARKLGVSATKVVEDAMRAYEEAHPIEDELPPGLERKGRLLVLSREGRPTVTLEQALADEQEGRDERDDWIVNPRG